MEWTCPNCGRTGLTGNFCGSCATPRPTSEISSSPEPTPIITAESASASTAQIYEKIINSDVEKAIHDYVPPKLDGDTFVKQEVFSNERFEANYNSYYDAIVINDKENDCTIHYSEDKGYIAFDMHGQKKYHIYPDGKTVIYTSNGQNESIITYEPLTMEDMQLNMDVIDVDGNVYSISNNEIIKKIDKVNGYTTYYDLDGNYKNVMDKKVEYFNKDGYAYRIDNYIDSDNIVSTIMTDDGPIYINNSKVVQFNNEQDFTGETIIGNYMIDESGNYIIKDLSGNTTIYSEYGKKEKYIDLSGNTTIYDDNGKIIKYIDTNGNEYNYDKDSKTTMINGKKSYSRINHIEYDEEAYNTILKSFNSIGESYKGTITNACSNIESAIKSFPDNYSASGISSIGSSIEGHIDLVNSLAEMTNYSLLAYQTCDESLKKGLYLLIDSLFGDKETNLANRFKGIIKDNIEDSDGDGILEYKENTNFKVLSENAIVDSTVVDANGNKWYLNKNKTVIGIAGDNIKINHGGETFSLTYDENGIATLMDSNNKALNIFGDYNLDSKQCGGNQNVLDQSYANKYVNDILSKYFPDATQEEKIALLSKGTFVGCGYTAITNFVFKEFEGKENDFYNTFGFPMYEMKYDDSMGTPTFYVDYNYEPVIMDLICQKNTIQVNGENSIKQTILSTDGIGEPEARDVVNYVRDEYGVVFDKSLNELRYYSEDGYSLYSIDGRLQFEDGGPHAMVKIGETEDGRDIISSWGEKFIHESATDRSIENIDHTKEVFKYEEWLEEWHAKNK